jgi:hypothetical protein
MPERPKGASQCIKGHIPQIAIFAIAKVAAGARLAADHPLLPRSITLLRFKGAVIRGQGKAERQQQIDGTLTRLASPASAATACTWRPSVNCTDLTFVQADD